ncbi:hypothetical protein DYU11_24995 [Fibrisoma montanum]|uniref:Uncharacterized protein n=1 Tax=Fibrisoma montanum TaxID=2305895 RepID=A0A418M1I9_9BACT|nr:hypothetical protein [Fibrisoma montanum]RIV19365.1 hypothetical protein DYU11_24995 [Fibrisoma montanum]
MATNRKQLIRVVFDLMDEAKNNLLQDEQRLVTAPDPDEAIEWVFNEMQRQFKRSDVRLNRVRICA